MSEAEQKYSGGLNKYQQNNQQQIEQHFVRRQHTSLKKNLSQLKEDMKKNIEDEVYQQNYYDLNHPRTKQVEQFIIRLKKQKQQLKKRKDKQKVREQYNRLIQEEMRQLEIKRKNQERHQEMKEKLKMKEQLKYKNQEQKKNKQIEYKQFIENRQQRNTPLFQLKQEEFIQNYIIPDYINKSVKIQKIKEMMKPIDIQQINEHQRRYVMDREKRKNEKNQKIKMQQLSMNYNPNHYYKGRYRQIVINDMLKNKEVVDPILEQLSKKERRKQYAQRVKKQHSPKVNLAKKLEQHNSEKRIRMRNYDNFVNDQNGNIIEPSSKIDGLKNLQQIHQMVHLAKVRGMIKQQESRPVTLEPRIDYLRQFKRKKNSVSASATLEKQLQAKDMSHVHNYEDMKMQVDLMDRKADMKEKLFKVNQVLSAQEANELEGNYVASIKAKISLLGVRNLK